MRAWVIALTCMSLAMVAGCATSDETAAIYHKSFQNPEHYNTYVKKCSNHVRAANIEKRRYMARLINVSLGEFPAVYCERFAKALRNGGMSSNDILSLNTGMPTPNVIRIARNQ
ncbi:uncharacterized protein YgiB involved in biofilm formation [Phyllobacterium ifriqiyense]|uniref:Uncharacterized protein YgiB involved in biofilm formation n=1 Tax=Phyllobacterium ifriqiyense TaxID=314238 RepID=A0ABU0SC40_9HYPH|nr:uncharacterized protein YgiB involved in biofilm formation [Phyllobacterium ifriqiyense]